jgi:hypothetical protein
MLLAILLRASRISFNVNGRTASRVLIKSSPMPAV